MVTADHSRDVMIKNFGVRTKQKGQQRKEQDEWSMYFYSPIESLNLPCPFKSIESEAVFINNIFLFKKKSPFYFQEP